jgi:Ca2+-binding EF-hand superfamily protein/RNA polymerase subunit RPABC4/transcription elongation factor Spt4
MTDGNADDVNMAECGVCRAVVPINSENCPGCGVSFSGVSDEALGECGACKALIPLDSQSCTQCGVTFVADNVIEVLGNWLTATGLSTRDLFEKFDADKDGSITSEEFRDGLLSLKLADLPPSQIDRLVAAIDEDGNGIIDLDELSNTFGEENAPLKEMSAVEEVAEEEASTPEETITEPDEEVVADDLEVDSVDDSEDDEPVVSDEVIEDEEVAEVAEESVEEESEEAGDEPEEESETEVVEDDELTRFGKAIVAAGHTIREVFELLDTNEDGRIDGPELQEGLAKILGEDLVPDDVFAILKTIDKDEDGNIDAMEIIEALENLELGIESDKSDVTTKKEFPSPVQKFIMSKIASETVYPILYFLAFAFITIWIVNGLGLIVDGTGGNVIYDGHTDGYGIEWDQGNYDICATIPDLSNCKGHVSLGDSYPCDPAINDAGCANSLTPLMEHSSMKAGFYGDGIFMIVLGLFGFSAILFTHLVYAKSLRAKVKQLKDESGDADGEEVEETVSPDEEDETSDGYDEPDEDEDAEADGSDADIDIGSEIGLVLEGEEFYGVIIEFDDEEGLVVIETEDGEEITGYQDDMFIE